jgi:delta-1-pyrroline-5-carboxylate synthetase
MRNKIVPILNTNDAIAPPPERSVDIEGVMSIKDNDSLAARLAVLIDSELLVIMSDVNGLYNKPPSEEGSRLLHTFNPNGSGKSAQSVSFGEKSKVGTGGMKSKVQSATWALENNCSVVICNGQRENAIVDIIDGKRVGTFFTLSSEMSEANGAAAKAEAQAKQGTINKNIFQYISIYSSN